MAFGTSGGGGRELNREVDFQNCGSEGNSLLDRGLEYEGGLIECLHYSNDNLRCKNVVKLQYNLRYIGAHNLRRVSHNDYCMFIKTLSSMSICQ